MSFYPDWLSKVDETWTLFLDRDGTINVRLIDDYVKTTDEFVFLSGAEDAMAVFNAWFHKVIVITNQQGVGKGLMTQADLDKVHDDMLTRLSESGATVDEIYACTMLATDYDNCRKPKPTMGLQAKMKFPKIQFSKSIMIGDMPSDIRFAEGLGMKSVYLGKIENLEDAKPDLICESLSQFVEILQDVRYNI